MPIYEYRCQKCGEVSEVLLLGREDTPVCTSCGSSELTKLMSAPNISMGGGSLSCVPPAGGCSGSPDSCGNPGGCCGM
jgi:putative FmdB family regulatory protein